MKPRGKEVKNRKEFMETSKPFSYNTQDFIKLVKSLGIAIAGAAATLLLGIFDFLDVDGLTAVYTGIGTFAVNALRVFIKGQ